MTQPTQKFIRPDNAIRCWDITIAKVAIEYENLSDWMIECKFKKWCFQLEKGSNTGYLHWQCRVSLEGRGERDPRWMLQGINCHWSVTSKGNTLGKQFYNYCTKDFTRIEGPWTDKDDKGKDTFIPSHLKNITLLPFQQTIINLSKIPDTRFCNVVIDPTGNLGKTTCAQIAELCHDGFMMPPINDGKEMVQNLCGYCMSTKRRICSPVMIDMPRAMSKSKSHTYGFFSGIEQIKNCKLYDTRNKYKSWWIESPSIWVFTNEKPSTSLLSKDRWIYWTIVDMQLVREGELPPIIAKDKEEILQIGWIPENCEDTLQIEWKE